MDIDYLIASDMRETIQRELPGAWEELQTNKRRFLRLTSQLNELAVKAKHHLSSASLFEDYLSVDMDDVTYRLTVERFNEMIAPLTGQTLQTCRRALDEAGVKASEVSAVLMVGGTSRIPLVREIAKKITGSPAQCVADLELAVAQGALDYRQFEQKKRQEAEAREKARREAEAREKARRETEARERAQKMESRKKESKTAAEQTVAQRTPPQRLTAEALERLVEAFINAHDISHHFGKNSQYFEDGLINSLSKLKRGLRIPPDEKVLLAHDTTFLVGKDKGTIVTNRGIYCRPGGSSVGTERVDFTSWAKLKAATIHIEEDGSIWDILDNGRYISLGLADSWNQFWPDLQKYLCSLHF